MNQQLKERLRYVRGDELEFLSRLRLLDKDGIPIKFNDPYSEQVGSLNDFMSDAKITVHLKPRQIGDTTVCCGYNFTYNYLAKDGVRTIIVAHHGDSTDAIFNKITYFHEKLPVSLQRPLHRSNRKELIFDDTLAGFRCMTAGRRAAPGLISVSTPTRSLNGRTPKRSGLRPCRP
jgi:hypothetical protein